MVTFGTEGRQVVDLGVENAGSSPSFLVYSDLDTLAALTQPVVYEIAGGTFYFDVVFPVPGSLATSSIVARIAAGSVSRTIVITPQPINTNTGVIREVVELLTTDTGLAPVFVVYQDTNTQEALSPEPDIAEIGSGLYYFEYEFPIESSPDTTKIDWVVSAPIADPASLDVAAGSSAGGTTVVITGTDFNPDCVTVTFGGDEATVVSATTTSITVTTPAHADGAVDVVVTNCSTSPSTLPGAFTYESAFWADSSGFPVTYAVDGIAYDSAHDVFVVCGDDGSGNGTALISSDKGHTWVDKTSALGSPAVGFVMTFAAAGSGKIVLTGNDGVATSIILVSADGGNTWASRTIPACPAGDWRLSSVVYNGSVWLADRNVGGGECSLTSADTVTWTAHTLATIVNTFPAVVGSTFLSIDTPNSLIGTCTDGFSWVQTPSAGSGVGDTGDAPNAQIYNGTIVMVLGNNGLGATANFVSADGGANYTAGNFPALTDVFGMGGIWDGTQWIVAVNASILGVFDARTYTSLNDSAWAVRATETADFLYGLVLASDGAGNTVTARINVNTSERFLIYH